MSESESGDNSVASEQSVVTRRISYLLFDGSAVKIGSSQDYDGVMNRLKGCQTGNPNKITLIGVSDLDEYELHERFKEDRLCGEWFRLSHELLDFIASTEVKRIYKVRGRKQWFKEYV